MPRDFGISADDKREIARLIDEGWRAKRLAKKYGVELSSAKRWVRTYEACGLDALVNLGAVHRKYSDETKLAAAIAVADGGLTRREAMIRYGIASEDALKNWVRKYRNGTLPIPPDARI